MDWLQSSTAKGNRSVIKDLGPYTWTDGFMVPLVAPLPKLKPGEVRTVSVDVSGGSKPKIDPLFVKAVVGHMYVIHVVDDDYDFYALFRVDQLMRGDNCVISWKLVDAPSEVVRQN